MDDLERYSEKRKKQSVEFAETFDAGYEEFKIGAMLRQAREQAGISASLHSRPSSGWKKNDLT